MRKYIFVEVSTGEIQNIQQANYTIIPKCSYALAHLPVRGLAMSEYEHIKWSFFSKFVRSLR